MTTLTEPVAEFALTGEPQIFHCEQKSLDWWNLRRGIPTASAFDRILTPAKGQPSAQQDEYIAELIAERSEFSPPFVVPDGGFVSDEMTEGIRREPEARNWYAMQTDGDVRQVGFVLSACGRFGASPDGLVGEDGGLELKNPSAKTHVKYLLKGTLPVEYKCQLHGSLIVTGRKWWSFVSYCPGFAPLHLRIEADDFTAKLRDELERFDKRYKATLEQIKGM
jgi:hypothetical protein